MTDEANAYRRSNLAVREAADWLGGWELFKRDDNATVEFFDCESDALEYLELIAVGEAPADEYASATFTRADWLLIADAISNSDIESAVRVRILDALPN